jgi:hypothetical protein
MCVTHHSRAPPACSRPGEVPVCRPGACANGSDPRLEQKSPITNCVAIPGQSLFLYSGATCPRAAPAVLHVNDLIQPRPEQITRSCRLVLLRPHRSLQFGDRITLLDYPKTKLQAFRASDPESLPSQHFQTARKRLSLSGLEVLHGRLESETTAAGALQWLEPCSLQFRPRRPVGSRSQQRLRQKSKGRTIRALSG